VSLSFANPLVLLLLAIPALLLGWVWRRADRRVVLPFDHGGTRKGRGWWVLVNLAESMAPLLLAVVILLLAEPQKMGEPEAKRKLTNIELLIDVSGSMTAQFGEGTRYDTSMVAIENFLNFRKGDAVGLTFFGSNVIHWTPLTTDASAVRCAPPFMRPEIAPPWMGGTLIAKALRSCRKVLVDRNDGDRMIVMITDGDSFDLYSGVDMEIAQELKNDKITVYSIHISDEGIPDSISNVTVMTGGDVFAPDSAEALKQVFAKIDKMHQAPMERKLPELKDNFVPYCVVGLSLLAFGMLAMFGWRYTPW
jgi:Ca-activated chloride channel homolog